MQDINTLVSNTAHSDTRNSDKIKQYGELAKKWSKRYNLLGNGLSFDQMVKHSKALFDIANPGNNQTIVDIGSGVGFPSIVWAIESENRELNLKIHLVERRENACTFLKYCKHTLSLTNLHVHQEDILNFRLPKVDIITAQAFSSLLQTVRYSYHLWNQKETNQNSATNHETVGIFLKTSNPTKEIEDLKAQYSCNIETHKYEHGTIVKIYKLNIL